MKLEFYLKSSTTYKNTYFVLSIITRWPFSGIMRSILLSVCGKDNASPTFHWDSRAALTRLGFLSPLFWCVGLHWAPAAFWTGEVMRLGRACGFWEWSCLSLSGGGFSVLLVNLFQQVPSRVRLMLYPYSGKCGKLVIFTVSSTLCGIYLVSWSST